MSEVRQGDVLLCHITTNCGKVTALTSSDGSTWSMVTNEPPKWWQLLRRLRKIRVELWVATAAQNA
jgi:hypothetical protein